MSETDTRAVAERHSLVFNDATVEVVCNTDGSVDVNVTTDWHETNGVASFSDEVWDDIVRFVNHARTEPAS